MLKYTGAQWSQDRLDIAILRKYPVSGQFFTQVPFKKL